MDSPAARTETPLAAPDELNLVAPERPREGVMHHRVFAARVHEAVRQRVPDLPRDCDKSQSFHLLEARCGARALVELGFALWPDTPHPVLDALTEPHEPQGVLRRWMRLERFAHTHNRTHLLEARREPERLSLLLEHRAEDGRLIHPHNHLFIWGLIAGLFHRAQLTVDRVQTSPHGTSLIQGRSVLAQRGVPQGASRAEFHWPTTAQSRDASPCPSSIPSQDAVRALFESDVSHPWRLATVARQLHLSPRSLQRTLERSRTTFSELLLDVRLSHARKLLTTRTLSLADVAFCAGFSDQAHFARVAKQRWLLSPSQFRVLLGDGDTAPTNPVVR